MKRKCPSCNAENEFLKSGNRFYCPVCGSQIAELLIVNVIKLLSASVPDEIKMILIGQAILVEPIGLEAGQNTDEIIYTEVILPSEFLRDTILQQDCSEKMLTYVDKLISDGQKIKLIAGEFEVVKSIGLTRKNSIFVNQN